MKVIYYILFLSALFHFPLIYGQETDYNKKVTELINRQDWSAANEVMQNHKNNISQETAQIAQILINTNMNRPVKAISELKKLLEQEIEDDNWFLFLNGILLENYDNLHDYQGSQSICTNLLNSKRFPKEIQEDIARRKAAYQSLTNHPKFQVKKSGLILVSHIHICLFHILLPACQNAMVLMPHLYSTQVRQCLQ